MARDVFYRQCRLVRPVAGGECAQVSWIPEPFAATGRVLKLREDGAWVDGWVVVGAGTTRLRGKDLPDAHDLIRGHRRATGDAS